MEYDVRFCTSADGTRIAYGLTRGAGERQPPLVSLYQWLVPMEAATPDGLALVGEGRRRIGEYRVDRRGLGHSQRAVADVSLDRQIEDVEAVVDALGAREVDLLGYGDGAIVAAAFARQNPGRVRRLALGMLLPNEDHDTWPVISALMRANWSLARRTLYDFSFGDVDQERRRWYVARFDHLASQQVAVLYADMFAGVEWPMELVANVRARTLVVHSSRRRGASASFAHAVAAGIPNAKLLTTEASEYDTAYDASVHRFLDGADSAANAGSDADVQTILFTDLESSTATTQRLGDAAAHELVRAHNSIVRTALAQHGGHEIKHTGDGIMASFGSASGAVECAIAIQRAMAKRTELPRVRIGLNAGEPIAEEGDLFGTTVQLARRICDHAVPGAVLVSNVVRELAAGKGFLFAAGGTSALKGFDDPVRLFSLRWREEADGTAVSPL